MKFQCLALLNLQVQGSILGGIMKICQFYWQLVITISMWFYGLSVFAATNASFNEGVALVGDGACNSSSPSQFFVNYTISGSVHDTLIDYYSMYLVDGRNTILSVSTKTSVVGKDHTHVFAPTTLVDPIEGPFKFIITDSTKPVAQKDVLGATFRSGTMIAEKSFDAHALDSDCPKVVENPNT